MVYISLAGHVGRLCLALRGSGYHRQAEREYQPPSVLQDLGVDAGGGLGILEALPALGNGLLPGGLGLLSDLRPAGEGLSFKRRGLSVEDEGQLDSLLQQIGGAVEQAGEMGCYPALAVHKRRAVLLPDYAQKLVEGIEGINRHPSSG